MVCDDNDALVSTVLPCHFSYTSNSISKPHHILVVLSVTIFDSSVLNLWNILYLVANNIPLFWHDGK